MWKKTAKQLLKEFWIPGLLAISWTTYVTWGTVTVQSALTNLGPSFFLAAWLTGQVFRVRKQAGVETSLQGLEGRLTELVDTVEAETKELLNHMNGGDSFCILKPFAGFSRWIVLHHGDYHLRELTLTMRDLDADQQFAGSVPPPFQVANLGMLFKGVGKHCFEANIDGGGECRRFNVYFDAANGRFDQSLVLKKMGPERWVTASRVTRNVDGQRVILLEEIDPDFPLDPDGTPGY